jgi:hypothetical protein
VSRRSVLTLPLPPGLLVGGEEVVASGPHADLGAVGAAVGVVDGEERLPGRRHMARVQRHPSRV